jgi:hypothetical protein
LADIEIRIEQNPQLKTTLIEARVDVKNKHKEMTEELRRKYRLLLEAELIPDNVFNL